VNIYVFFLVGFNGQSTATKKPFSCRRNVVARTLTFFCPVGSPIEEFDIDDLDDLNIIEKLQVIGIDDRGPLTSIPKNICRLKQLKVNTNK